MTELTLTTTLEPFGPATAIMLTDAQVEQLGGGKRAPVTVTVDGRTTRVRLVGDTEAARVFDGLAFTHRKEYATWVGEAKQATTRERRAERALEMIRAGQTRS